MMTKKREMAEWILDFFRRAKIDAGHIVMMRNIQNRLHELNPKERDLFVPVANELIKNGYFTYEEGTPQCLRLTEKGSGYIYNPSAELDCCYEEKYSLAQAQYIENWHQSFVTYTSQLRNVVIALMASPVATEADKHRLELCRLILDGKDVAWIEKCLANAIISKELLDKIEKLNKDLLDVASEQLTTDAIVKVFLRQLVYLKIEQDKKAEEMRLGMLKIPVK